MSNHPHLRPPKGLRFNDRRPRILFDPYTNNHRRAAYAPPSEPEEAADD